MHLDIDDAVLGRARQIGSHHTEFCFGARHRPVTTTVFEYRKGTLSLTGCTISGNKANGVSGSAGGGIYFQAIQTINMGGKPVITGNTGNDGCKNNLSVVY